MSTRSSLLSSLTNVLRPAARPIDKLLKPLETFARHTLAGAGLLMFATVVAIAWANSPWSDTYHHLLELKMGFTLGNTSLHKTIHHWINDGLMGVFFFMVGLEIKRELMVGELSSFRKATLPAVAAVGGMVVPAAIYLAVNRGGPASEGWGIPMATDIAFALGALALLGDRVPLGLKVFLTALAIVDDIGAVVVIALFYTADVSLVALGFGVVCLCVSAGLNLLGARSAVVYFIVGTFAWLGFLESGVHATIAAILMAFTIPARTHIDGTGFVARVELLLARLKAIGVPEDTTMNDNSQQHCLDRIAQSIELAGAPLQRIEHALSAPVTFLVLPIFALANAGVAINGGLASSLTDPIVIGIVLGLVVGKTVGVSAAAFAAVRFGFADLPTGVSHKQVIGVAMLAGIGFTMALFVASLAFSEPAVVETAKVGILIASVLAGVGGILLVRHGS
jgi:NhaA family Na+:H+ antiporter